MTGDDNRTAGRAEDVRLERLGGATSGRSTPREALLAAEKVNSYYRRHSALGADAVPEFPAVNRREART
jgi:hypothetical protein